MDSFSRCKCETDNALLESLNWRWRGSGQEPLVWWGSNHRGQGTRLRRLGRETDAGWETCEEAPARRAVRRNGRPGPRV